MVKEYCLVTAPDLLEAVTEMQTLAGLPAEDEDAPPEAPPKKQKQPETTLKQDSKSIAVYSPSLQATLHLRDRIRRDQTGGRFFCPV